MSATSPAATERVSTATAAERLAAFAAELAFSDIPPDVILRAKHCFIDTVAAATFGTQFPWSQAAISYALRNGSGDCPIAGSTRGSSAALAAFANGTLAHAFELDSYRYPAAGVHPGAALVPAVLAVAHEQRAGGHAALTAFVAACEALFRIGLAAGHTSEPLGFDAPGLTTPFGAALAAGMLMDLDAERLALALGIAGSFSSGLLAFRAAGRGAMVERLHVARACEGGVLAASLAADGFEGPPDILEGQFGFLHAYARDPDPARLGSGLGEVWETRNLGFKRYAAHLTAHTPIQSASEMRADERFTAEEVAGVKVEASERVTTHHAMHEPGDLTAAQHSVPFCVALALYRDAGDPRSFSDENLADPAIRDLARRVECVARPAEPGMAWSSRTTIALRDGRTYSRELDRSRGMPYPDYDATDDVLRKWHRLVERTRSSQTLLDQLEHLDEIADLRELLIGNG